MDVQKNSRLYLLLVMGMLSAFGPFVTDFYLPGFPSITDYFKTSASMVQLSLTSSMLGLGLGQLFVGPLSDKYGRKPAILGSLVLFLLSTVACIFSPTIELFIVFRFIQGIAGSGGVVVSKSVAADLYKGKDLTAFFSMLMVVNGLGPIAAPVFGGITIKFTNWQGIFVVLLALGVILLISNLYLKESLLPEKRAKGNIFATFRNFGPILRNKQFMLYVLSQTTAVGFLFGYIASSPFIFQNHYQLGPIGYALCFAVNSLGVMLGSRIATFFRLQKSLIIGGISLFVLGCLLATILFLEGGLIVFELAIFAQMTALGIILPTTSSLALDIERKNSGAASAILGFLPFLSGSIVSPLVGLGNILTSTALVIFVSCLLSLVFTMVAIRNSRANEV
ncbi:multidrug effflux MFS transporter [Mangrovibacterium diazotrophicum]|uniref:DHA1 family bicyclomycin/chloramphenicol resistance-like MFS transporter n=1 Tax=Mangrovibacterium diazotrophicum TaxID=1261403 RepID=A0A419W9F0_9BACT|nr:multidrug effflux MFS transporter [Mangrovibacterium diazotrophicum]RKD92056.1 DHA1 family bicyclomycin/chloramphenicol resistance-like MFS transporter [Mangrovibacterium diazotrophicum]